MRCTLSTITFLFKTVAHHLSALPQETKIGSNWSEREEEGRVRGTKAKSWLPLLIDHEWMQGQNLDAVLFEINEVSEHGRVAHLGSDKFGKLQKRALQYRGGWVVGGCGGE